jgi:hypothetical protein
VGYIPRKDGESLRDYFERILSPLRSRKGLILQMNRGEESVPETLDLWRSLQNRYSQ